MRKASSPILPVVFLLIFGTSALFSLEFSSPSSNFRWTVDFTLGRQNFSLMSSENGTNAEDSFALDTRGLIFQSFYKNRLLSRMNLDLGFTVVPDFLWTESPNFANALYSDRNLNENLRSVEVEYQSYLPRIGPWFFNFLPFAGFSFVEVADENFNGDLSFNNFSLSAGVQYFSRVSRLFSHTYYVSYSPMVLFENFAYQHTMHYMNVGAEFMVETRHISLVLFAVVRKVYEEFENALFFSDTGYNLNTNEIGFSFKMNLM